LRLEDLEGLDGFIAKRAKLEKKSFDEVEAISGAGRQIPGRAKSGIRKLKRLFTT
jgi:hypothetical protein